MNYLQFNTRKYNEIKNIKNIKIYKNKYKNIKIKWNKIYKNKMK